MAEVNKSKVLENCGKNLDKGRAVATGIGIFTAVVKDKKILLRVRQEKGSLYDKDLSGNWELIGGGTEIKDFDDHYTGAIFHTINRELPEESGLLLNSLGIPIAMFPAWLCKNDIIDLAFVVLLPWNKVQETDQYWKLLSSGQLGFFTKEEADKLNIVSPRMKRMISDAFSMIGYANLSMN